MQSARVVPVLVVLGVATSAAEDIDSETFRSTPAVAAEAFQVEPADVGASGEWIATTVVSYAANPLSIDTSLSGTSVAVDRPVTRRTMLEVGGAYAFGGRFEAGARVPMFQQRGDSPGTSTFHVPAADGFALGDVGVHGRVRLLAREQLSVGAALHVTLPTSTQGQFVGVDGPTGRLLGLAAWRPLPALSLTVNAGAIVRAASTYRNDETVPQGAIAISQGSGAAWGIGANMRVSEQLRVTGEVFGAVVGAGDTMRDASVPIDALVGARYQLDNGLMFGVAAGRGVTSSLGTPELRGVVAIAFVPSRATKQVVHEAEPEPIVEQPRGGAGKAIPADSRDRCPFEAEDMDGFEDGDGCPDPDNDHDLIADAQDKCPRDAEVINGVDDNDGCPDVSEDAAGAAGSQLSPMQAAEETFKQGLKLMKEKKFARACAAFEQSQRLDPQFGTQFNIAGCYVEIGKLSTAWTMYRELSRADKNVERRRDATALANELAKRVPKIRLTIAKPPPGLQVFMNGANANVLVGVATPIDFGRYEITVGAPGFAPWRKTIHVDEEGKVITVTITLEAVSK